VLAQPPGVAVFGSAALAVHDSLQWLRVVVGAWQVAGAVALAGVVWSVTAGRVATIATPVIALALPWTVHEFGQLTPETVATPVLAIGLLLVVRGHARSVGVIAGLLVAIKLPYVLPAVALIVVAGDRRGAAVAAALTAAGVAAATFVLGGSGAWSDLVVAQSQSGLRAVHDIAAYWAQGTWNLVALLVVAGVGFVAASAGGRAAMRPLVVVAGATLLSAATTAKLGTALNVLVPVEAMLAVLAIVAAVDLWRTRPGLRWLPVVAGAALALQTASLVISPTDPKLFLRPGSKPAWGRTLSSAAVSAAAAHANRCPAGVPVPGPPLVAFAARRSMPADQPDQFLIAHSGRLSTVRDRVAAVTRTCS
jgi:hypothetical protein